MSEEPTTKERIVTTGAQITIVSLTIGAASFAAWMIVNLLEALGRVLCR